MKTSRFNHFFQVDDGAILAYNGLTTAFVELSAVEFAGLKTYCDHPDTHSLEQQGLTGLQDELVKMGFLIDNEPDELEVVHDLHTRIKAHHRTALGLTIVPTLDCNFRCSYCFSYTHLQRMSDATQSALLRFIAAQLPESKQLGLTWYGGEPTLCLDIIEDLSQRIQKLCADSGTEIAPASIVTNGYLLTESTARRLKAAGVKEAQITLDGDQAMHDQRRPRRGGGGTFDRILDNITRVHDILDIQVRINVDRANAAAAVGALDSLAQRGLHHIPIYFGQVQAYTEACAGVVSTCLTDREYSELNLALTRQALVRGFNSMQYPRPELGGVCGAEQAQCWVVAPDGLLFKCWAQASLGAEHSVGSVHTPEPTSLQQQNLDRFIGWDVLSNAVCRECSVLPLCMGGCPYMRLNGESNANCSTWRYGLLETLALRYKLKQLEPEPVPGAGDA